MSQARETLLLAMAMAMGRLLHNVTFACLKTDILDRFSWASNTGTRVHVSLDINGAAIRAYY